mmetsp:Transcript_59741/g.142142  ORF Transcript_59741/g.142142 Transcript_59741/m.142142 type:complete len:174 (-) Transcript_59741:280-801(-)
MWEQYTPAERPVAHGPPSLSPTPAAAADCAACSVDVPASPTLSSCSTRVPPLSPGQVKTGAADLDLEDLDAVRTAEEATIPSPQVYPTSLASCGGKGVAAQSQQDGAASALAGLWVVLLWLAVLLSWCLILTVLGALVIEKLGPRSAWAGLASLCIPWSLAATVVLPCTLSNN